MREPRNEHNFAEAVSLWQLAGRTALARLRGQFRRPNGLFAGRVYPRECGSGLDKVEISTHGFGVPWLHIRIESHAQYDPSHSPPIWYPPHHTEGWNPWNSDDPSN